MSRIPKIDPIDRHCFNADYHHSFGTGGGKRKRKCRECKASFISTNYGHTLCPSCKPKVGVDVTGLSKYVTRKK